jgi:DNA binding protein with HTH domain
MVRVFTVSASQDELTEIESFVRARGGAESIQIARTGRTSLMVRVESSASPFCQTVFRLGAVCTTCPLLSVPWREGTDDWSVLLPTGATTSAVVRTLLMTAGPAKVVRKASIGSWVRELTTRQRQAIEVAYRIGYYGYPRQASLREVANALSVTSSTAAEILQRGIGKLLAREQRSPGLTESP